MKQVESSLEIFVKRYNINSKGSFALVLFVTRNASWRVLPLSAVDFLTPHGSQVAGLGKTAVQAILSDHGINRILAEEGGRTSQGSVFKMKAYLCLLNQFAQESVLDFRSLVTYSPTPAEKNKKIMPPSS